MREQSRELKPSGGLRTAWTAAMACGLAGVAGTAAAQTTFGGIGIVQAPQYSRGFNTAVRERQHPEWQPIDIDIGAFTLSPQLSLTANYTDNEKYATTDGQSDEYFRIQPSIGFGSNWNRNGVGLQAYVAPTEYARFSEDDSLEYGVSGTGRIDVYDDLGVDLRASDQHLVLTRSDPDVPTNTDAPVYFDRQDAQITVTKTLPTFQLQGVAAVRNEDYGTAGLFGGGVYDATDRSGTYATVTGRISYGVSPAIAVFLGALYDKSFRPSFDNLSQDASGANVVGGVNFDLSRLARGEVAIGYLYQSYDTPGTQSDSGLAFNVDLQYFPTQLTTISIKGERTSAPSNVAGTPGGITLGGSLQVDHELLRNVILSAGAEAGQTQYRNYLVQNVGINRTDVSYGGTLEASYLMNRLVSWDLTYGYAQYTSNDALRRSYTNNRLSLTLRLTR